MKLCYVHLEIILVLLFLFSSSGEMVKEAESGGTRCNAVMDPGGCILQSCRQRCFMSKNGNGMCIANVREGYQCVCYYNC
ncbi:hypothetical protein Scep_002964 [Stephania cephalantha]|uniref:Uncharacterized protein n=1 Tax=Stephania cephalantha TaxID=152367 RepID=A0AAP0LAZ0_9MAGN